MLAVEMFLDKKRIHRESGIDLIREISHLGDLFQNNGIVYGVGGISTPSKRPVIAHQYAGRMYRVDFLETSHNDSSGFFFVVAFDLGPDISAVHGIASWK